MTEGLALALVVGIVVSMPVGPTATLCIRQSFAHGMTAGMLTAMGAAVPDAVYAAAGILGSRIPQQMFAAHRAPLHWVAGIALAAFGLYLLRAPVRDVSAPQSAGAGASTLSSFLASLMLSLPNPGAAIVAAAIFSAVAVAPPANVGAVCLATFAGTIVWWLCVTGLIARVRRGATTNALRWVDRACAAVMLGAGALSIATAWT